MNDSLTLPLNDDGAATIGLFASKDEAIVARKRAEALHYPEMCP